MKTTKKTLFLAAVFASALASQTLFAGDFSTIPINIKPIPVRPIVSPCPRGKIYTIEKRVTAQCYYLDSSYIDENRYNVTDHATCYTNEWRALPACGSDGVSSRDVSLRTVLRAPVAAELYKEVLPDYNRSGQAKYGWVKSDWGHPMAVPLLHMLELAYEGPGEEKTVQIVETCLCAEGTFLN